MKSKEIKALFTQFEQASAKLEDVVCRSARELQILTRYACCLTAQNRNINN
jgi:hypothetical protein